MKKNRSSNSESNSSNSTHFSFTTITESLKYIASRNDSIKTHSSKSSSSLENDSEKNLIEKSIKVDKRNSKRIVLNARGVKYEVLLKDLEKLPKSRLGKLKELIEKFQDKLLVQQDEDNLLELCDGFDLVKNEYYFNRDPYVLNMFLNFYNNDRLHMDDNVCAYYFGQELQYWNIEDINIDACCQFKYFDKKDQINEEIKIENKEKNVLINEKRNEFDNSKLSEAIKKKIWNLMDKPSSSIFAKIVQLISIILILLPIVTYIISTLPNFSQPNDNNTSSTTLSFPNSTKVTLTYSTYMNTTMMSKSIFENTTQSTTTTTATTTVKVVSSSSTIFSVYFIAEIIASVWFTIDYLLRLYSTPTNRFKFLIRPYNIIDLISNLPFYIGLIISATTASNKMDEDVKSVLRTFQILRIIRVTKNSVGLKAIGYTFKKSRRDLGLLICIVLSTVLIICSFVYLVEKDQPDTKYDSIPATFYWGLVTMTSVGYGDMTPSTTLGKCLAGLASISGVLIISLPIAVFTKHFNDYFVYSLKKEKTLRNIHRKEVFKQIKKENTLGWLGKRKIIAHELPQPKLSIVDTELAKVAMDNKESEP